MFSPSSAEFIYLQLSLPLCLCIASIIFHPIILHARDQCHSCWKEGLLHIPVYVPFTHDNRWICSGSSLNRFYINQSSTLTMVGWDFFLFHFIFLNQIKLRIFCSITKATWYIRLISCHSQIHLHVKEGQFESHSLLIKILILNA